MLSTCDYSYGRVHVCVQLWIVVIVGIFYQVWRVITTPLKTKTGPLASDFIFQAFRKAQANSM